MTVSRKAVPHRAFSPVRNDIPFSSLSFRFRAMLPVSGLAAGVGDGHDLDDAGGTFAVNQSKWKFPEQELRVECGPAAQRSGASTIWVSGADFGVELEGRVPGCVKYQSKAASYSAEASSCKSDSILAHGELLRMRQLAKLRRVLPTMGWSSLCRNLVPRCACQSRPPGPLARPRQLCRQGLKSENPPELPVPHRKR